MSKILGKIFGNAGGSVIEKLSGVADKFSWRLGQVSTHTCVSRLGLN